MAYGKQLIRKGAEKGSIAIWGSDSFPWNKDIREEILTFQKTNPIHFLGKKENLEPLFNFCRVVSESFSYLFFFGKREVVNWVRNFLKLGDRDFLGRFFIFDDTQEELLFEVRERFDESALLIFLGRKNDELSLLPFVSLFECKKAFVGREHGVFADVARLAFHPFFPVKLEQGHFWHYSELLYVPLSCVGSRANLCKLDEGFWWVQEAGKEVSVFCALILYSFLKDNYRVFLVTEDDFSFNLVDGFRLLFERVSLGKVNFDFYISDIHQFGGVFLKAMEEKHDKCLVFFIKRNDTSSKVGLQVKFPVEFKNSLFWESVFSPMHRKAYRDIKSAVFVSLERLLSAKNIPYFCLFLEGEFFFSAGVLGSFMQDLACYLGFLNGVNLLEEPSPCFLY